MAGNYTRRINLYINGTQVRNDIKSINAEMIKLSRYTKTLNTRSREYHRNMARISRLNRIITEHNAKLRMTQINLTTLKGLANAFNKYWPVVMGTIGAFAGLAMGTRRASEEFAEFDDKITDVMKVTGKTREEVVALNETMKGFDTKTAQNDLLDLMWVAGKLGLSADKDLLGFVKAADIINVSLSKDLGGNAEEAVRSIGKTIEIFDLAKVYGIEEAMLRVGSAVNALGMASVAQEGYLIKFVERVAGIAPLADVSIQNILGLAGALDIYGQKSEVSATAYSKLMSKMATETESMAKIMGMSIEDYVTLFTDDANEAMLRLFESLKGEGTASFTTLVQLLGETDLEGQRMTQVMGTLVKHVKRIREQQEISNIAFAKGVSVTNEYNLKNTNSQAILEKKQKAIKNLRVELGEKLFPIYMSGLGVLQTFLKTFITFTGFVIEHGRQIISLTLAIITYQVVLRTLNAVNTTTIFVGTTLRAINLLLIRSYYLLTGNIYRAAKAQVMFNSLALKNPWVAITALITAAGVAVYSYAKSLKEASFLQKMWDSVTREHSASLEQEKSKLDILYQQLLKTNPQSALRRKIIDEINTLYPDFLKNIDAEKASINELTTAYDEYIKKLSNTISIKVVERQMEETAYQLKQVRDKIAAKDGNIFKLKREEFELTVMYNSLLEELTTLKNIDVFGEQSANILNQINEIEKALNSLDSGKLTTKLFYNEAGEFMRSVKGFYYGEEFIDAFDEVRIDSLRKKLTALKAEFEALNKVTPPPTGGGGGGGGGGGDGTTADYSEDAEIQARIAAKRKYQKGIIATEIDLQTELDKIALRFMQGRLSQMDKDAEKRAELQEKIVDKQIEIANDNQKRLDAIYESGVELSPVQREQLSFNNELKKLNIFHKQKKDFTTNEYLAYEALAKQHRQNLDKLDAAAIKEEFDHRQNAFENNLSRLKLQHLSELEQVNSFEQAMAILRKTHTDEELKDIKTLNQAKLKIQDDQQNEEADMTIEHLAKLRTELQQLMETGVMDGVNLADNIMSQDEWDALQEILNALIEKLEKLKKVKKGDDEDDGPKKKNLTLKGKFRTDILGFTMDDWIALKDNLKEGEELTESLTMAAYALANAWSDVNGIISNAEDTWLQGYENKVNKRKKLLENQLEQGIINQEYYNYQVEKLDEDLEKKKAEIAIKQAKRDKAVAIFQAIINTASAIAEALPNVALATIASIAGAMQIALIAGTPLPDAEGYEEGGFIDVQRAQDKKRFRARKNTRKRGWITEPTILAGEKPGSREYVIPDEAMDNPSIAPMIEMLEMARISHNLKTVDLSTAIPAMPGRQAGGFIYQETGNRKPETGNRKQQPGNSNQEPITQLYGAIATLNQILASGDIKTKIVYQDLRKMQEKVQAIEGNSFI